MIRSAWILWLTCCYFMLTNEVRLQSLIVTVSLMQDGLWCCLFLDVFDLEFLRLFSSTVMSVAKTTTKEALKLLSAEVCVGFKVQL